MVVKYKTVLTEKIHDLMADVFELHQKKVTIYEVKLMDVKFCCNEMKEAWDEHYIKFGGFDTTLNKNMDVNIFLCHPFPEGACWDEYPIRFCPFCSAKVITKEVERVILEKRTETVRKTHTYYIEKKID